LGKAQTIAPKHTAKADIHEESSLSEGGLRHPKNSRFVSPMSERLKDLQRQRVLAQEQLAWIDREIARETGTPVAPPPAPASPAAGLRPSPSPAQPVTPPSSADADAIIAQYQEPGRSIHTETKRGCFLYFFAALAVVALGVTAYWFLRYRH
jgi:hypothetical protein